MLSPKAEKLINDYFNLPFKGLANVRCPYFNYARRQGRGQLRVLIGKGEPEEIVEEAKILSIQYHHDIFDHEGACKLCGAEKTLADVADCVRKFLIDNDLGVDCSGFTAHVLRAHYLETKEKDIFKVLPIARDQNIWRRLIAKFRPAENLSVRALADNVVSELIADGKKIYDWSKLQPGDMLVMLETGPVNKRNHIVMVENVENGKINYVGARAWASEGKYDHGVSRGEIELIAPDHPLLAQTWEENGQINDLNETYLEAKNAKIFEVRRLKI